MPQVPKRPLSKGELLEMQRPKKPMADLNLSHPVPNLQDKRPWHRYPAIRER